MSAEDLKSVKVSEYFQAYVDFGTPYLLCKNAINPNVSSTILMVGSGTGGAAYGLIAFCDKNSTYTRKGQIYSGTIFGKRYSLVFEMYDNVNGIAFSSFTGVPFLRVSNNGDLENPFNDTLMLSKTTLGPGIINSSLTSVGTLTSLTVSGNVTIDSSTLKVDSTNNRVGIVNSSPAYPLDVVGDCNLSTGSKFRIDGVDIMSTFNVLPLTLDTVNNRVGINNITPSYPLDVVGDVNISTGSNFKINGVNTLSSTALGSTVISSSLTSLGSLNDLTVIGDVIVDSGTLKVDSVNNRVGINKSNPAYALDIVGSCHLYTGQNYMINNQSVLSQAALGSSVTFSSLTRIGTLNSLTVTGDITIDTNTLRVDSANNKVGIVNSTPAYPLDIVGDANVSTGSTYRIGGLDIITPIYNSIIIRPDIYSTVYQQVLNSGNLYYGHRLNNTGTTNIFLNARIPSCNEGASLKIGFNYTVDYTNQGTLNNIVFNSTLLRLPKATLEGGTGVDMVGTRTTGTAIVVPRPSEKFLKRGYVNTNITLGIGDSVVGSFFRDGNNVLDTYTQDVWITDIYFFVE